MGCVFNALCFTAVDMSWSDSTSDPHILRYLYFLAPLKPIHPKRVFSLCLVDLLEKRLSYLEYFNGKLSRKCVPLSFHLYMGLLKNENPKKCGSHVQIAIQVAKFCRVV